MFDWMCGGELGWMSVVVLCDYSMYEGLALGCFEW